MSPPAFGSVVDCVLCLRRMNAVAVVVDGEEISCLRAYLLSCGQLEMHLLSHLCDLGERECDDTELSHNLRV